MTFGLLKVSKTQKVAEWSKWAKINKKKGIFNPLMAFIWPFMAFNGLQKL